MRRYGFGDQTGTTDEGGLAQYANGHVEVSEKASKHATQEFPRESPAGATALVLARVGGVDLSEYADPSIDATALRDAVEDIDGVGESTADEIVAAVEDML